MAFNKAKALEEAEKLAAQNKVPASIQHYENIFKRDHSDLSLLNTLGDLYVRIKNLPKALEYFNRLGDAYMREGFNLKGIAILRKVVKLDPQAAPAASKLAELYSLQGLTSEARPLLLKAANIYLQAKQEEQAVDSLYRLVNLDPANVTYRTRLADVLLQMRRSDEATNLYLEMFDTLLAKGDLEGSEKALRKITQVAPEDPRLLELRARLCLQRENPQGAIDALTSGSESGLPAEPSQRKLLLQAYVAVGDLDKAEELGLEMYRSGSHDFAPLGQFCDACIEKGDFDRAMGPLNSIADDMIKSESVQPLLDILRKIQSADSTHLATLELLRRVYAEKEEEQGLPEVLETLGHEYTRAERLEEAREVLEQLVGIEPQHEEPRQLLRQVLEKLGVDPTIAMQPAKLAAEGVAFSPGEETPAEGGTLEAVAAEAFENSELYARYRMVDKAVTELEKVLAIQADHVETHERLIETCYPNEIKRAIKAARALQDIHTQRQDSDQARKYKELAEKYSREAPEAAAALAAEAPSEAPAKAQEFEVLQEPPGEEASAEPVPVPESGIKEMDLSQDFGDVFGGAAEAPVETEAVTEPEVFNPSQAEEEIQFYLGQQLFAEARQELETLEQKLPGNSEVAALRDKTEEFISKAEAEAATPPAEVAAEAPIEAVQEQEAPPQVEATPAPEAARPAEAGEGTGFLEQLAGEVEAGLKGVADAASASEAGAKASAAQAAQAAPSAAAEAPAGPLSDLLAELELGEEEPLSQGDAETHYNLGIAFREMGLLDEAISEFQKVVQNVAKNAPEVPPNFLQSCHLLALCFMEKEMPRIAVKWYQRALDIPELESETILALYYDLGLAYEQGSDIPAALESFTEVYSQNIDYRDVAERIQLLQKKSS